jgi:hypothetical protein
LARGKKKLPTGPKKNKNSFTVGGQSTATGRSTLANIEEVNEKAEMEMRNDINKASDLAHADFDRIKISFSAYYEGIVKEKTAEERKD